LQCDQPPTEFVAPIGENQVNAADPSMAESIEAGQPAAAAAVTEQEAAMDGMTEEEKAVAKNLQKRQYDDLSCIMVDLHGPCWAVLDEMSV
jgi:hypothetical protein